MKRYSVQPRDQILVKGHGFLFFARNMGKNISKNTLVVNTARNFFIMLNNLLQMH